MIIDKDPDAVLNYSVNWAPWLDAGDEILTSTWIIPAGVTKESESNTTTKGTVIVSGGTVSQSYKITNRITTKNGLTDNRSITLQIKER